MKPLDNILVLDLTRALAGPFATMILRNLGARVIKVERPVVGDDARQYGPFHKGESAYFASINAGKESITLDLQTDAGKELLRALALKADVLIENYVPGVMERLALGYEELHKLNPALVYAAASGFGHSGPRSQSPAYDMIVQAAGGVMSITGPVGQDAPPVRVGTSIGDITAALYTAIGIMAALYQRSITGQGQKVDVGMLDCQVSILENAIARCEMTGIAPAPLGAAHPTVTPFQAFRTRDSWIIVAVANEKLWKSLCHGIGREDLLARPEFQSNELRSKHRAQLLGELEPMFFARTSSEWQEILGAARVPASPINTIDKVLVDPQVRARNMIVETSFSDGRPLKIGGNPIKMSTFADELKIASPPALGQDTIAVLSSLLGLSEADIQALHDKHVTGA